jgi:two-component system cell cycle response regulator
MRKAYKQQGVVLVDIYRKPPLILIIDDDWMTREILEAMLTGAGYDVLMISSGEKALTLASDPLPGLILLDVRLQGMSGYEVCRRFKMRPDTRDIPILMVTALRGDDEMSEALEAGAEDLISKPFSTLALLTRMRNLLLLKQSRDALAQRDAHWRQILERYVDQTLVDQIMNDLGKPAFSG